MNFWKEEDFGNGNGCWISDKKFSYVAGIGCVGGNFTLRAVVGEPLEVNYSGLKANTGAAFEYAKEHEGKTVKKIPSQEDFKRLDERKDSFIYELIAVNFQ